MRRKVVSAFLEPRFQISIEGMKDKKRWFAPDAQDDHRNAGGRQRQMIMMIIKTLIRNF